jgi:hypothetical protein
MSEKVNFSVKVKGTRDKSEIIYSAKITHLDKFYLLKVLLDDCYQNPVGDVPEEIKNSIIDKMVIDARDGL